MTRVRHQCVTCKKCKPVHAYGQCQACAVYREEDITLSGGSWVFNPRRRIHEWKEDL